MPRIYSGNRATPMTRGIVNANPTLREFQAALFLPSVNPLRDKGASSVELLMLWQ